MRTFRTLLTTATLSALLVLSSGTAQAQDCQPSILNAYNGAHKAEYDLILPLIAPELTAFSNQVKATVDQTTYAAMLLHARSLAPLTTSEFRVLIALPDGTVMLDTSKPDDPTNVIPGNA